MLSLVILIIMLGVIMLHVIMLSVVAPCMTLSKGQTLDNTKKPGPSFQL